jgi:hypothetical protein
MHDQTIKASDEVALGDQGRLSCEAPAERRQFDSPPPVEHLRSDFNTGWEIVVRRVTGLAESGEILVTTIQTATEVIKARSIVSVTAKEIGRQAVIAFENGDTTKPIILGLITEPSEPSSNVTVSADGDKFVVLAEREIELRCGEASITLTRAGKVLIKGEYVLSRAKGLNRIKGAAVSIN